MKQKLASFLGLVILFLPTAALAADYRANEGSAVLSKNENVKNYYTAGKNVEIEGYIQKDLIAVGSTITINGNIGDDIIAAGQNIEIKGNAGGSVRIVGDELDIAGKVDDDLMAAGNKISIQNTAIINDDLDIAAKLFEFDGKMGGNIHGVAGEVIISGLIQGDVFLESVESLTIKNTAQIKGQLHYKSAKEANIENGAAIGSVDFEKTFNKENLSESAKAKASAGIYKLIAALIGLAFLIYFFPTFTEKIVGSSFETIISKVGWGLLVLFVYPIISLILLVIPFTMPVGLALLLVYILLLILAGAFSALFLGNLFFRIVRKDKKSILLDWQSALIGALIAVVIGMIPIIGPFAIFVIFLISLGTLSLYGKALLKK